MGLKSNSVHVAVMPGDGIGVEVTEAAMGVLGKLVRRHGLGLSTESLQAGAFAYQETGTAMSEPVFERARQADAILLGAMGWPGIRYPDGTEIAPQLDLRFRLGLYAGVRPIRAIPGVKLPLADARAAQIDMVILRESTEGLFAARGRGEIIEDREARDTMVITRATTERLSRFAFRLAERRAARLGRKQTVTLVDKANVFTGFAFMRKVFLEVAQTFPEVPAATHYIDAMALDLVRRPWDFDVLPTENMFGDILSDLGAGLIGGMGYAPSADIGDDHAVFQPSHGTGPDIAGKGIANPTAMILSAALMLDWLGAEGAGQAWSDAAAELEAAVDAAFRGGLRSAEFGGSGTAEVARAIAAEIPG
ncbi:isocitrate/isopropylmalate dehydrogenase family protein [Falsiroseomonas selenitidurans]|uniref:Isocitrate/isopropylmalate dehydrogenase family protein n=1 Tax=Falsiroseomonas selenitidurans TaxID=2716335 RepID=A0ABX1E220_9PROT|nr:isocitrate/isopropylmalate family dehydrogenase [Falsiroseomonas selenitidurans]NKC31204.1 isocitrate/isopropylmalate dehydrogenase family protein [Falsiroseomonas selenitidurans]